MLLVKAALQNGVWIYNLMTIDMMFIVVVLFTFIAIVD